MNNTLPFGTTRDGSPVSLYRLRNRNGVEVDLTNFGATLVGCRVPDREGRLADVVLGYDDVSGYETGTCFLGAIVGRFGNRIARGRFSLDGKNYEIPCNNGPNSLHGGPIGFGQRVWRGEVLQEGAAVRFTHGSPDGEQGYPGALTTIATYTLTAEDEIVIDYRLTTDAATVTNVTNHAYFNLRGEGTGDILDHEVWIDADRYTPTDDTLIPTGELASVEGTPMDFREPRTVRARVDAAFPALRLAGGYDHNYVLNGTGLRHVATVHEPISGRELRVSTTEPGVQFYCGNFLASEPGKNRHVYPYRSGFCLETQHFPDSPNQPAFPSTVLRPGEKRASRTIYKFIVR